MAGAASTTFSKRVGSPSFDMSRATDRQQQQQAARASTAAAAAAPPASTAPSAAPHSSPAPAAAAAAGDDGFAYDREPRSTRSSSKFIREQLEGLARPGGRLPGSRETEEKEGAEVEEAEGAERGSGGRSDALYKNGERQQSSSSSGSRLSGSAEAEEGGGGSASSPSAFEEDEDAGALQWSNLQPLDKSDDTAAAAPASAPGVAGLSEVAAAASALLSGLPKQDRNGGGAAGKGDRREDDIRASAPASSAQSGSTRQSSPPQLAALPRSSPPQQPVSLPFAPIPSASSSPFSPTTAANKRHLSSLSSAPAVPSVSSAQSAASSPSLFASSSHSSPSASSAASKLLSNQNATSASSSSRKRRKKEDEESSLNLAYERQISTLNEAIRQLLAYVSPLHSHTDAFVDELISAYRGEYMKEQLRDGRTAENKKFARAMAAYFLTFYHNANMSAQLQHHDGKEGGAAGAGAGGAGASAGGSGAGGEGSSGMGGGGLGSSSSGLSSGASGPQRDPWEGVSHPLYSNVTLLLYTIIDALLMDTLQVVLFSLYLERLEPFFILEPSPASQARLLLLTAYAMKLAYLDNHSIFLPYLTGLYSNFSRLFSEYLHSKQGVKLGIANTQLTARFRLFGSLREKD